LTLTAGTSDSALGMAAEAELAVEPSVWEAIRRAGDLVWRRPLISVALFLVVVATTLSALEGATDFGQATINGVVAGNYFALGRWA
jgi:hypothetical protein